jgi:hypothetical protein
MDVLAVSSPPYMLTMAISVFVAQGENVRIYVCMCMYMYTYIYTSRYKTNLGACMCEKSDMCACTYAFVCTVVYKLIIFLIHGTYTYIHTFRCERCIGTYVYVHTYVHVYIMI